MFVTQETETERWLISAASVCVFSYRRPFNVRFVDASKFHHNQYNNRKQERERESHSNERERERRERERERERVSRPEASPLFQPVSIQGQIVEQVQVFRFLGIEMDTSLSFSQHTDATYKKARLHLLRKLITFQVSKDILTLVYRSLIESVLTFHISSWYNQLTIKHKTKLTL